jgi:hypothetical protein
MLKQHRTGHKCIHVMLWCSLRQFTASQQWCFVKKTIKESCHLKLIVICKIKANSWAYLPYIVLCKLNWMDERKEEDRAVSCTHDIVTCGEVRMLKKTGSSSVDWIY